MKMKKRKEFTSIVSVHILHTPELKREVHKNNIYSK